MNKTAAYIVIALLCVAVFFVGRQSKKCEDCQQKWDSIAVDSRKTIDSLQAAYDSIALTIKPVTNDPETIVQYVARRHRLQRRAGVDSSERVLFSDPE